MESKDGGQATPRDSEMMRSHSYESAKPVEKSSEKSSEKKKKAGPVAAFEAANVSEKKDTDAKPKVERLADLIQIEPVQSEAVAPDKKPGETLPSPETATPSSLEVEASLPENLEDLSEGEEREALQQILQDEGEQLGAEHSEAPANSTERAEVLVAAAFVQSAHEKIQAGKDRATALTEAQEEVTRDLDLGPLAGEADTDTAEVTAEMPLAAALETDEAPLDPDLFANAEPAHNETEDAEPDPLATITTTHASVPPPSFPTYRYMNAASGPPSGGRFMTAPSGPGGSAESAARHATFERRRARNRGVDLLVGGIVGYMIGRRHGRINTQERMRPIQQSLEKKVKQLQYEVGEGVKTVRKLTAERIAHQGETARQRIVQGAEARPTVPGIAEMLVPAAAAAVATERTPTRAPEARPTPEEQQRHERHERIRRGPDILPVLVPGIVAETVGRTETHKPEKLPMPEVLQVAARIEIAGTNAKALYEQGRLEKQDLQVIAQEYIRGSNRYERMLIEKLRPPRTAESMERIGSQAALPDDAGLAGGGTVPTIPPVRQSDEPRPEVEQLLDQAANNRLAQAHLEDDSQKRSATTTLLVIGAAAATIALIVGFAVF